MMRNKYIVSLILCSMLPMTIIAQDSDDIVAEESVKRAVSIDTEQSSLMVNAHYLAAQITSATKENWKEWAKKGALPLAWIITIWTAHKLRQTGKQAAAQRDLIAEERDKVKEELKKAGLDIKGKDKEIADAKTELFKITEERELIKAKADAEAKKAQDFQAKNEELIKENARLNSIIEEHPLLTQETAEWLRESGIEHLLGNK